MEQLLGVGLKEPTHKEIFIIGCDVTPTLNSVPRGLKFKDTKKYFKLMQTKET